MAEAAARTSETNCSVVGNLGSTSTAMRAAPGRNSRKSPSCFGPSSAETKLTPVTLPPGRLRLTTRPSLTGSPTGHEDDWHRRGRGLGRERCRRIAEDRDYLPAKKVRHQNRQPVSLTLGRTVFDGDVLALDIASLLHASVERRHLVSRLGFKHCPVSEKPYHRHRCLLPTRRQRPCRHTADERDEVAAFHSITSSANVSSADGIIRPSALAVF